MVLLNPTSYALLYVAAVVKDFGNAALSGVMYGMLADTVNTTNPENYAFEGERGNRF